MAKRLYRSEHDRVIAGVCGGLGQYFDIDPTLIRVVFVILLIATGVFPLLIIYLVMAIVVPLESKPYQEPRQTVAEGVDELKGTVKELGKEVSDRFSAASEPERGHEARRRGAYLIGLILIVIGIVALVANFGGFLWWGWLWPAALIVIGLAILWGRMRR